MNMNKFISSWTGSKKISIRRLSCGEGVWGLCAVYVIKTFMEMLKSLWLIVHSITWWNYLLPNCTILLFFLPSWPEVASNWCQRPWVKNYIWTYNNSALKKTSISSPRSPSSSTKMTEFQGNLQNSSTNNSKEKNKFFILMLVMKEKDKNPSFRKWLRN